MKNGPVAAKVTNSRPRDRPNRGGVSEMSAVSSKSALWASFGPDFGPKVRKLSTPPPSQGQIQGIHDREPEMEPRRPVKPGLLRSTPPKMADFEARNPPKRGHSGVKRGTRPRKSPPKIPFFAKFEVGGVGEGPTRPKSPQSPIFSGSTQKWALKSRSVQSWCVRQ